jgi:hypothetical protein
VFSSKDLLDQLTAERVLAGVATCPGWQPAAPTWKPVTGRTKLSCELRWADLQETADGSRVVRLDVAHRLAQKLWLP